MTLFFFVAIAALMTVVGTALLHAARVSARAAEWPLAGLHVSPLVSDGMVLQRQARVPIWGSAAPGTTVTVALDGHNRSRDSQCQWRLESLSPADDGGRTAHDPHPRRDGTDRCARRTRRRRVGGIRSVQHGIRGRQCQRRRPTQIAAANDTRIRQFKVPQSFSNEPSAELAGGKWVHADREHVPNFQRGRLLLRAGDPPHRRRSDWNHQHKLGRESDRGVDVRIGAPSQRRSRWQLAWDREVARQRNALDSLRARVGELPTVDAGLVDGRALWADPALDESRWTSIGVPKLWERCGIRRHGRRWLVPHDLRLDCR